MAKKKTPAVVEKPTLIEPPVSPAAQRIEDLGKRIEGNGRNILYVLGGLLALLIIGGIIYTVQARAADAAQTALGKAIEINNAAVAASPVPNSPGPTFATDKERAEKSVAAFDDVAAKYGSPYKEKAQYFAAVNRLKTDRETGLKQLEDLSKNGNAEVAALSKFALAEARAAEGKYDDAASLYTQLLQQNANVIAPEALNFALAAIYEKQNKKPEAADIYFNLVKSSREAKDSEGKPLPASPTATEAASKLQKLDADKYATLPAAPSPLDL